jgi:lysophospholipase L1-like esterase
LLNLGVSGATSANLLEPGGQLEQALAEIQRQAQDGGAGNEVEVITVETGGDGILLLAREEACLTDRFGDVRLWQLMEVLAAYEQNLRQILRALRAAAPGRTL